VLARFVPVVRTLTPMPAGIGEMGRRTFTIYNIVGAAIWAIGVSVAGWFLGKTAPSIDRYLLPIIFVIVILSVLPPLIEIRRQRARGRSR
jgi:membrane-associated protein